MKQITLDRALAAITAVPSIAYSLSGSPGVGKTFKTASRLRAAGYKVDVIACQNMIAEDMAMLPRVNKNGTVSFLPNEMWAPVVGEKRAFILDELFKAHEDVVNSFLGLLFGKPHTMQGFTYPEDTVVVTTSNPTVFGAGDTLRPHHINRMVNFEISDPSTAEAKKDMIDLGFDARVIAWAEQEPAALCSYSQEQQKKPESELSHYFGYLERHPKQSFCSMRSMEIASRLMASTILPTETLRTALEGCIGANAAYSLSTYVAGNAVLVSVHDMIETPDTALVPDLLFDQRIAALTAAASLTRTNWKPLFQYAKRLHPDVYRSVFLGAVQSRESHNVMNVIPAYNREFITAFADGGV